jgi:hypothetical protein
MESVAVCSLLSVPCEPCGFALCELIPRNDVAEVLLEFGKEKVMTCESRVTAALNLIYKIVKPPISLRRFHAAGDVNFCSRSSHTPPVAPKNRFAISAGTVRPWKLPHCRT